MDDYDFNTVSTEDPFAQNNGQGPGARQVMENEKKDTNVLKIVLIVVGVIFILGIVGSIILAGVTFWASSFEENNDMVVFAVDVQIDAENNELEIVPLSGTYDWSDYTVKVDDQVFTTTSSSSSAGDAAFFTTTGWDAQVGQEYTIKIVDIDDNKVVWQGSVTAGA